MSAQIIFLFQGVKVCRINLHSSPGLELLDEAGTVVAQVAGRVEVQVASSGYRPGCRGVTPDQLDRLTRVLDNLPESAA